MIKCDYETEDGNCKLNECMYCDFIFRDDFDGGKYSLCKDARELKEVLKKKNKNGNPYCTYENEYYPYEDGYKQGGIDIAIEIYKWAEEQSRIFKKQYEVFDYEESFGAWRATEDLKRHLEKYIK